MLLCSNDFGVPKGMLRFFEVDTGHISTVSIRGQRKCWIALFGHSRHVLPSVAVAGRTGRCV